MRKDSTLGWRLSIDFAEDRWASRVQQLTMTAGTAARYVRVLDAFCHYAVTSGVSDPRGASPALCKRFSAASTRGGRLPTGSTARVRLAAIRDAFEGLVEAGLVPENPTFGLRVDQKQAVMLPCPLTPQEAQRLFAAGRLFLTDTLRPACLALALVGATHVEVARAVVADVDLAAGRVRFGGGTRSDRTIDLEVAAAAVLTARVDAQRREWRRCRRPWVPESVPLAMHRPVSDYAANSVAPTVSMNLARALKRAGIAGVGVRPRSCREYAANAVYARTGRVEDVARRLGIGSLDAAYRLIDWEWQRRWAGADGLADERLG